MSFRTAQRCEEGEGIINQIFKFSVVCAWRQRESINIQTEGHFKIHRYTKIADTLIYDFVYNT